MCCELKGEVNAGMGKNRITWANFNLLFTFAELSNFSWKKVKKRPVLKGNCEKSLQTSSSMAVNIIVVVCQLNTIFAESGEISYLSWPDLRRVCWSVKCRVLFHETSTVTVKSVSCWKNMSEREVQK